MWQFLDSHKLKSETKLVSTCSRCGTTYEGKICSSCQDRAESLKSANQSETLVSVQQENVSASVPVQLNRPESLTPHYAGFWRRVLAGSIDYCLITAVLIVIAVPALAIEAIYLWESRFLLYVSLVLGLVFTALMVLYFGIFESSDLQATPGKLLLGLKVTNVHENRLLFRSACAKQLLFLFVGFLLACIPLVGELVYLFLYSILVFSRRKQSVFDKITGRLVLADTRTVLSPSQNKLIWSGVVIAAIILGAYPILGGPVRAQLMCSLAHTLAAHGDRQSQYRLGVWYRDGVLATKDTTEAIKWFRKTGVNEGELKELEASSKLPVDIKNEQVSLKNEKDRGINGSAALTVERFSHLKKGTPWSSVVAEFGQPDTDVGSGIHIYVYRLSDSSTINVGCVDRVLYVDLVKADGKCTRLVR